MPSSNPPTLYGEWFFESRYRYFRKRLPIKRLYLHLISWAERETGLNLTMGKGKTALDVGCAYGFVVELLGELGYEAYGVDVSKFALIRGVENTVLGDAEHLPFKESSFDLVTCFETIEHLRNPERALKAVQRVLKPGGVLLISTPTPGPPATMIHVLSRKPASFHPSLRPVSRWVESLMNSKLKVAGVIHYLLLPIPPDLLKRYFILKSHKVLSSHIKIVCVKSG
jgi:SAM-dependent methyltransferase